MKPCSKCGDVKPLTEFYKGINKCKDCTKAAVKARYLANPEKIREYERSRANLPHRVSARKNYATTEEGKAAFNRARKKYMAANPVKRAAHVILGNAVRDKRVTKPKNCQECGATGRIHGHHDDYAKPLEVDWLCSLCHKKRHKTEDGLSGPSFYDHR